MTSATLMRTLEEGVRRHRAGDHVAAARCYAEVLAADPDNADAWNLLGVTTMQNGDLKTAGDYLLTARQLAPQHAGVCVNLAAVALANQNWTEAETWSRASMELDSSDPQSWRLLSQALRGTGRFQESLIAATRACELRPNDVESRLNLGAVQLAAGQLSDCLQTLNHVSGADAVRCDVLTNRGAALRQLGRYQESLECLNKGLSRYPGSVELLVNRGNTLLALNHPDEALTMFQRAVELRPKSASALNGLGLALQTLGCWGEALESLRLAWKLGPDRRGFDSNYLYCASLCPQLTRSQLSGLHRHWGAQVERSLVPVAHVRQPLDAERRLNIGYVSPDFRSHATMRFFLPVLRNHCQDEFRITCYSETQREDSVTREVESLSSCWRSTAGMSDEELKRQIQDDEIDILIDLAGHTSGNRLAVFASQAAPVQCTWLGYPNTTGLTRMQWMLTDAARETPQTASWFSEKLLCLPGSACCFTPPADAPPVCVPPMIQRGIVTLGSTHRLEKISPSCLAVWARILNALPNSRLLVFRDVLGTSATVRDHLLQRIERAGISRDRVVFGWEMQGGYLNVYSEIDVLLDVFPWASGTTAWESTWMGVPIPTIRHPDITCAATASLLKNCGHPELIAGSVNELVGIVERLVNHPDELCRLRATLRDKMASSVCDAARFTSELEIVLRGAWRSYCRNDQGQELHVIRPEHGGVP